MRSAVVVSRASLRRIMEGTRNSSALPRYFSDSAGRGRILGEEERAAENVYIQKMERERMEKRKIKAEKENAEKARQDTNQNPPQKS